MLKDSCKVVNCYNLGKINGASGGGISGSNVDKIKFVSCYNAGELGYTGIKGITSKGVVENCYYLTGCGVSTETSTSVTSEQLSALAETLDYAYSIDDENNTISIDNTQSQGIWISGGDGEYPKFNW